MWNLAYILTVILSTKYTECPQQLIYTVPLVHKLSGHCTEWELVLAWAVRVLKLERYRKD